MKRVLFLGYSPGETFLIEKLVKSGLCEVRYESGPINTLSGFDLAVSYGYRHIISERVLSNSAPHVINLHISYLPWNRGAFPNFWSFFDGTPSGVSIHLMDSGIDTGPVIAQEDLRFDTTKLTFRQTYVALHSAIQNLFVKNLENIIDGDYILKEQADGGSFHKKKDLPVQFRGWDSIIGPEISRLKKIHKPRAKAYEN